MPRWRPDGFERLQAAAFELFHEQGFERTTVAEIAARAGLSQRTFFNHFSDKREVLFALGSEYEQAIVGEIAARPESEAPLDAVVHALQVATQALFDGRRAGVARRHEIVEANPELHERELSKRAALSAAIAVALVDRGVERETARLTADAGLLVQDMAIRRWIQEADDRPVSEHLLDALHALRETVGR